MGRRSDLEGSIRESYDIIREHETILQTSNRPEEKLRARRAIDQQWELIREYLGEHLPLVGSTLPADIAEMSADIAEIAAHFSPGQAASAQPA
jgi:hypothetical protein